MSSRLLKSRLPGPFLVSFVLCFGLIDYIIYSQTSDSLLGWLWKFIAFLVYVFQMLPISQYFSAMGLFVLGAIVLFFVVIWLSKDSATRAMRAATDQAVVTGENSSFQTRPQTISAVNYVPPVMSEPLIRQQPAREPQSAPAERPSLVLFRSNKEPLPAKTESPPIDKEGREHRTLRTRVDRAFASVRD